MIIIAHFPLCVMIIYGNTIELQWLEPSWVILPCLTRTCSRTPMVLYMRLLWSNFCIYIFMMLFSFSILPVTKINNYTKTLAAEISVMGLGTLQFKFMY